MHHGENSNMSIKTRKDLLVWSFTIVVIVAVAVGSIVQSPTSAKANEGDTAQNGNPIVDVPANMNVDSNEVGTQADISEDTRIRLISFKKDMAIRDALTLLALKYNRNIVPSPKVNGTLAFTSLRDVTFKEAIDAILGPDFKYVQKGNLTKVYTKEEYKKIEEETERMTHKVFVLYYITAAEVRKLITPLLSTNGKIESTTAALTDFPVGESISSGVGGGDTTAMNDTIIIFDHPEKIADINNVIKAIDVRPKQVLIEATILNATLTEDMQFGIDWQTLHGTISAVGSISRGASDFFSSSGTGAQVESALTGGLTVGFAHDNVAGFIRAVEEITDVTILANPKILAINKQLGQIYIGNKLGYREGDTFDSQGNRVEGEVKFLDTGTKLSFRPYIGNDGYIRMDIHPKDSSGSVPSGIPQETSAELLTNIMVKDGQTIVIGGLFRDKVTDAETKVPLLGDLPILGAAFRGTADEVVRQEVIVLLTPHIIKEPSDTNAQARADDIAHKRFGAKNELEWVSRSRLAEDRYAKAAKYYLEGNNKSAMWELNIALEIRPTYLEALRLRERIISETDPDAERKIERKVTGMVEREDSDNWLRR